MNANAMQATKNQEGPFELQSAFVSLSGSVDYNVMYSTASGSLDILDVTLDAIGRVSQGVF